MLNCYCKYLLDKYKQHNSAWAKMQQEVLKWELQKKTVHYSPPVAFQSHIQEPSGDPDVGHSQKHEDWLGLTWIFTHLTTRDCKRMTIYVNAYTYTEATRPPADLQLQTQPQYPFRWDSLGQNVITCGRLMHCFFFLSFVAPCDAKKKKKKV